ncbi:hypothetical protein QWJ26_26180 [Streptomyces sp. CSDS2]|nr:hypothetical protein [Streptomyces sp. CSDS2]MDN3263241.1 hypothetical protein [Streptomyces sp. CSDS2]
MPVLRRAVPAHPVVREMLRSSTAPVRGRECDVAPHPQATMPRD